MIHNENKVKSQPLHEGLITALAVGGFLILVGLVFSLNPNLIDRISNFFTDISTTKYPTDSTTSTFYLPAPMHPAAHSELYSVLMQFSLGFGLLQIIILALRLMYHSRIDKIAETVEHTIFWFGAAILVNSVLQMGTLQSWFEYWGSLIVIIGVSLVARGLVYFTKRKSSQRFN